METQFNSLLQVLDFFKEEHVCKSYLIQQRWGDKVTCPHCGNEKAYTTNRGYKCANKECAKKFSVTTGTIFENTKISLRVWFAAMYLCTIKKKGISSLQLSRELNITQKTAWFVLHRLREMLKERAPEKLKGEVEVDETFITGKDHFRHANKKKSDPGKKGGYKVEPGKTMVGAIERDGKVKTKVMPDRKKENVQKFVLNSVEPGSTLYSDTYGGYNGLDHLYEQHKVKHSHKEYVRGKAHTNTIENYWSTLKRGISGTYHYISPEHTQKYLDEFSFRFNSRKQHDGDRFNAALKRVGTARITYKQLTNAQLSFE